MWLSLVVLAAWFWSRYGGLKQLDWFWPHQEPIILYSVYDAIQAWFDHIVFVIREDFAQAFRSTIWTLVEKEVRVTYVYQEKTAYLPLQQQHLVSSREKPWWTAHATLVAKEYVDTPFAVINADDFYGREAFFSLANYLKTISPQQMSMVGYIFKNTLSPFWSINRWVCEVSDRKLFSIQERLKITHGDDGLFRDQDGEIVNPDAVVSMNFWWFHPTFFAYLEQYFATFLDEGQWVGEYFIPLVVDKCLQVHDMSCEVMMSHDQWCGVSYPEDKPFVQNTIAALHEKWVYPEQLFV